MKDHNSPDPGRARKVLLYVPNLIGYLRLLLLLVAAAYGGEASGLPWLFGFYGASQLLDAADGHAARRFKQVSVFGACLDQVLDRVSTCLLYILNAVAYPQYAAGFFCLLSLDVAGHWLLFMAAAVTGAASHKNVEEAPALLRLYYNKRGLMSLCILSYEGLLLCLLAVNALSPGTHYYNAAIAGAMACAPLAAFKAVTNLLQCFYGSSRLASLPVPSAAAY